MKFPDRPAVRFHMVIDARVNQWVEAAFAAAARL
jgi:hypothetical protein